MPPHLIIGDGERRVQVPSSVFNSSQFSTGSRSPAPLDKKNESLDENLEGSMAISIQEEDSPNEHNVPNDSKKSRFIKYSRNFVESKFLASKPRTPILQTLNQPLIKGSPKRHDGPLGSSSPYAIKITPFISQSNLFGTSPTEVNMRQKLSGITNYPTGQRGPVTSPSWVFDSSPTTENPNKEGHLITPHYGPNSTGDGSPQSRKKLKPKSHTIITLENFSAPVDRLVRDMSSRNLQNFAQ